MNPIHLYHTIPLYKSIVSSWIVLPIQDPLHDACIMQRRNSRKISSFEIVCFVVMKHRATGINYGLHYHEMILRTVVLSRQCVSP